MIVKVGDVVKMETGEILKFKEVEPDGEFLARVKSIKTGEWTEFHIKGASIKLPMFLRQQKAQKLDPADHPEPEESK